MLHLLNKPVHIQLMKLVLILGAAALGLTAGRIIDTSFQRQASIEQLTHDAEQLLERVESVVDRTIVELMDLSLAGISKCEAEALSTARIAVFSRATLKDIQVRDANDRLACSASPTTAKIFSGIETRSRNQSVLLGIAENMPEGLLHLRWRSNPNTSLVAMVGMDSMLYDFFGKTTRDQSSVGIFLNKSLPIATFGQFQSIFKQPGGLDLKLSSERYPVRIDVFVPETAILAMMASSGHSWFVMLLAGTLAALSAGLGIYIATRPLDPVKELRSAILHDEIVPFYQPIIKLSDESISGCEMLVRWIKPDGTMVRPDLFIPLAESSALITVMTMRVMRRAIRELMPVMRVQKNFKLAINVSPNDFSSNDFIGSILNLLNEEGIDPSYIVLELTERQQLQDLAAFKVIADTVQRAGLRISIDDVGTGHNGLSTIQDVPANIIKIDKKFVDTVATNALSETIVAMLVGLARKFERTVVAEGIETRDQLEALKSQGVDEGQGYLFSPALDAMRFIAFYGSYNANQSSQSAVSKNQPTGPHKLRLRSV